MNRVSATSAFVLHTRPYRDSSLLVDLLSREHGRQGAVARGARGRRQGNVLQPFNRLRVGWSGRGGLVTLGRVELEAQTLLPGDALPSGFYLCELLLRLLREGEAVPRVFDALAWSFEHLISASPPADVVLRQFEKLLLTELGYGIDFAAEAEGGPPIEAGADYEFDSGAGFRRRSGGASERIAVVSGAALLAIGRDDYRDSGTRRAARLIMRRALAVHLGPRPLASRALLRPRRVES